MAITVIISNPMSKFDSLFIFRLRHSDKSIIMLITRRIGASESLL